MEKNYLIAFILIYIAAIVGGAIPVLIKISLVYIPPFTFTFLRFMLASISFLPLLLFFRIKIYSSKSLILISLLATINIIFFVFGIPHSSAFIAQLLYSLTPIFIALISVMFLKKTVNKNIIIGIILGFLGIATITISPIIQSLGNSNSLYGSFLILIGVISFSIYSIKSKHMQKQHHPILLTFTFCVITMLMSIPFTVYEVISNNNLISQFTLNNIISIGFVGILGSAIFYLLLQYAIKFGNPLISSLTLFIQPVMTYIWAYFLLKETITKTVFVSSLLIFMGAYFVIKEKS